MFTRFLSMVAVAVVTAGGAAQAGSETKTYVCDFGGSPYRTETLLLSVDTGKGTAKVFNGAIEHVHGQPITVKISKRRNGLYRLRWKVNGLPGAINRSSEGAYNVTTETNNISAVYWLDFDIGFERPLYKRRVLGGGSARSYQTSRCKSLKGEIERYIKR